MGENVQDFLAKFKVKADQMRQLTPDMMTGFGTLFGKVMKEGALTVKQKELVAVGIALAVQCEPCIVLHIDKALDAGASKDEILEAAQVAVLMAGGPAYTHMPKVIEALESLVPG